ncbi:Holliday junction DNA helicase RuvA [Candidatus Adlerbacteria bacterium RIFCSPHIGHO2_02_FULL_54_18]|uniref:Holliday junction branch migration complex subunit RuvA n=2 Tax=Candidatus Adleribacteriota TaxID=1752736 RepID=A0A1F4Y2U3_9BACT|nr:MAG: Holliday junction DNA helicase RuvA [Candidatus Adlerbacteria bacterium RIFCSPLOWO2_01_FULL_54_21b]OGC88168.1 MAG: Holliday junction DNA helicase RuvA [Candidatus Adlerbacteria bacterium RIFCSPHIGHO2_02_FULL_54_18]
MIGKLTGVLSGPPREGVVLVEVGGVGYCVRVPLAIALTEGSLVSLYIHTAVREDAIDLYGFLEEAELLFFRQLMSVSGIGPKTALSIMSIGDTAALKRAIAAGDAAALHKLFGIGRKSAERLVVELRDKMVGSVSALSVSSDDADVVEALMALGYSAAECRAALKDIVGKGTKDRLGAALKRLGSRNTV